MVRSIGAPVFVVVGIVIATHLVSGEPPTDSEGREIEALIAQLPAVNCPDFGYSSSDVGTAFLPLNARQVQGGLLFQQPSEPSPVIRELVERGPAAVAHLIAHLGDERRTQIAEVQGFGNLWFGESMDFNPRTEKAPPETPADAPRDEPRTHVLTVGDLCFVALGQIVNRDFEAVRYIPSLIVSVNSPTHSPKLRQQVAATWGSLTPRRLQESLVRDFKTPDDEGRQIGAAQRLAYYFPAALEPVAVKFLARPTYDVFAIEEFVRADLSATDDPAKRRKLFDEFVRRHGEAAREGILWQLFDDLEMLEAVEEKRASVDSGPANNRSRSLLVEFYGKPKSVKGEDRPRFHEYVPATWQARVIEHGLVYDDRPAIDGAARDLLRSIRDEDYLALACMRRLVGRGFDVDIEAYCRRRLQLSKARAELQEMLDRIGWTRLHVAVEQQIPERIGDLARDPALRDATSRLGETPLHVAAKLGNSDAVQQLLTAGAKPDPKDGRGRTPAQLAAAADHDDVVKVLAGAGADAPDILVAAIVGRADRARQLLAADRAAVGLRTEGKRTPLHLAALHGHANVAELLLDNGADVAATDDPQKWMPIHYAAAQGRPDVLRVLIRHKADVNIEGGWDKLRPLHLAARAGSRDATGVLVAAGADVNARETGSLVTPLHLASGLGHIEVAEELLKRGADLSAADEQGRTPLHFAALQGHLETTKLLLARGAAINNPDRRKATPLHRAAEHGYREIAAYLLEHGADRSAKNDYDETPEDVARAKGNAAVVELFRRPPSRK